MLASRYSIQGHKVIDSQSNPVSEIYIREILDMPSHEFRNSKLSSRQKLEIINEIGLDQLIALLQECFDSAGKGYSAADEAELAMLVLTKASEHTGS